MARFDPEQLNVRAAEPELEHEASLEPASDDSQPVIGFDKERVFALLDERAVVDAESATIEARFHELGALRYQIDTELAKLLGITASLPNGQANPKRPVT